MLSTSRFPLEAREPIGVVCEEIGNTLIVPGVQVPCRAPAPAPHPAGGERRLDFEGVEARTGRRELMTRAALKLLHTH